MDLPPHVISPPVLISSLSEGSSSLQPRGVQAPGDLPPVVQAPGDLSPAGKPPGATGGESPGAESPAERNLRLQGAGVVEPDPEPEETNLVAPALGSLAKESKGDELSQQDVRWGMDVASWWAVSPPPGTRPAGDLSYGFSGLWRLAGRQDADHELGSVFLGVKAVVYSGSVSVVRQDLYGQMSSLFADVTSSELGAEVRGVREWERGSATTAGLEWWGSYMPLRRLKASYREMQLPPRNSEAFSRTAFNPGGVGAGVGASWTFRRWLVMGLFAETHLANAGYVRARCGAFVALAGSMEKGAGP